jgi:N-acetyl-anhydromuramyl-L-alanine amidase AmpD
VKAGYRNFDFYATFPEAQIASVVRLVEELCDRFRIPRRIAPEEKRAACDLAFFDQFRGIATHANFRRDKYDIGPAFDWSRLNAAV